ncbi:MAG TPA: hypothetical protein PLD84_01955 [Chitinophagales bacterium]|nr:hypothetical protein [Chitinophagales bacterium]
MKRLYSLLAGGFLLSLTMVSCEQGPKPMDAATMSAKVDSVARSQMQAVAEAAMNECTANQAMMVQMKADSLYNAAVAAMTTTK